MPPVAEASEEQPLLSGADRRPSHDSGSSQPNEPRVLMSPGGMRWNHGDTEDGEHMDEISHKESIYNSILFTPPIARSKHKHYWTREVLVAFAIFWVNVALQGGLTFIVGRHILHEHSDFLSSLIQDAPTEHPHWVPDKVSGVAGEKSSEIGSVLENGLGSVVGGAAAAAQCCRGSECAVIDLPCCAPRRPSGQPAQRPTASAQNASAATFLGKPSTKSGASTSAKQRSDALCTRTDGEINCSPPTLAFVDHWDELDANGDGLWTAEEARADDANLACRLGVAVPDVFNSACRGVREDAEAAEKATGRPARHLPKTVHDRQALPREYFLWWTGMVSICRATDVAYCGQLVSRGLFDGAMDPRNKGARGGVSGTDSAMNYCARLLTPGGLCDTALPGTYTLYRSRVQDTCGEHEFSRGQRYGNPFDATDVMGVADVQYKTHQDFQGTRVWEFRVFMFLILFVWYTNLVDEVKDLLQLGDFLRNFPVDKRIGTLHPKMSKTLSDRVGGSKLEDVSHDVVVHDEGAIEITHVGSAHWSMCLLMLVVRSVMIAYMGYAGTYFLLSDHSFVDLLMNSAALAFVFALDEFLYTLLVSDTTKHELERVLPLRFASSLPQRGAFSCVTNKAAWGLLVIPLLCVALIALHEWYETRPIVEALECACLLQGQRCAGAEIHARAWWQNYWTETSKLVG